jgi:hypothetical protein
MGIKNASMYQENRINLASATVKEDGKVET